jgi:5'-3' exonuclease
VDVYGEHMKWLFEFLYASGRGSMRVGGMEADDLIAQFVYANRDPLVDRHVYILSSDHDFKKLLVDEGVTLIQNKKDYDAIDLYQQYGCSAEEYRMAAYLSGDSSDNIQGIPGNRQLGTGQ